MKLADQISVKPRFARSANVERDLSPAAVEGYLLTGRALDVLGRIGRGMAAPSAGRALAITGPHGGGKSSLAVFLNAIFSPDGSVEYQTSASILRAADLAVYETFARGLKTLDPAGRGAVRAFAAASHEPVTVTVARALSAGARRALGETQDVVPAEFAEEDSARNLSVREIREVITNLCAKRPVVLVIDEFGKNLEAFAASGQQGDPYLLQWLAEAAQGESALPLFVITMQHLAFDEYAQGASLARRREWAKVQGRFQDIPYVETAREASRLIAAAIELRQGPLDEAIGSWYQQHADAFAIAGLRDLPASARPCYPLHPLAVAVLPELCARYGQNERTLFSFMAGNEPLAVPAYLRSVGWSSGTPPPFVGLDLVYDYFVDSSFTMISASATVSRWMEVETRIRDTTGLSSEQLRLLKVIGVLNLVSSSGILRASRRVLELATTDGTLGSLTADLLPEALASLEAAGLITYRDFADEYRIWQGSDFDLEGAVTSARRACGERSLAQLLAEAAPLEPAVAGRHSQRTGVLRIFSQRFSDLSADDLRPPSSAEPWDGKVLYATVTENPSLPQAGDQERPVVIVIPETIEEMRSVAVEGAALRMALASAEASKADWVARRELIERVADTDKALRQQIARTWGPESSSWHLVGHRHELAAREGVSAILSRVADVAYHATPRVANEMIARRELTSQGAKARRMLLEAFLRNPTLEKFGIEGYGPDRAIYEALYRTSGIHRLDRLSGQWMLSAPSAKDWKRAWSEITAAFEDASTRRVSLTEIGERLKRPPVGLKDGILPVLLVTALVLEASEIALYEHGSLLLSLDDAVAERLARNPGHFTIKNSATRAGARRLLVEAISARLGITSFGDQPTFLQVARSLYRELQSLPPFSQRTLQYVTAEAAALRQAFLSAVEPDRLIFETLPQLLGHPAFPAASEILEADADAFAIDLGRAIVQLREAYPTLLRHIWAQLAEATATWGEPDEVKRLLAAQATSLQGRVLEPRLSAFVGALTRELDGDAWIENVAMVVADGQSPRGWTDSLSERFGLLVADLGGTFRRVQALLFDRLAVSSHGYSSRRLTLTRPDGREISHVLTFSEGDRQMVKGRLNGIMEELSQIFGSRAAACQALLAHLAIDDVDELSFDQPESPAVREA
jgi:hypothetical protein